MIELRPPAQRKIQERERLENEKINSARTRQQQEFAPPKDKFYWFSQLDECIKCYGCRDACPLCHCKRCVLERDVPETVEKGVVPPPFTFSMVRLLHVASYCVNCGHCEDACSVDIPLSRLAPNLSKIAGTLFHYRAGFDRGEPLPYAHIPDD